MSSGPSQTSNLRDAKNGKASDVKTRSGGSKEQDNDDDQNPEMTASYSEISMDSLQSPSIDWLPTDVDDGLQRPDHLELRGVEVDYLDELEGTVTREGDLVAFVAEDLEAKIKLSSPKVDVPPYGGSRSSTPCLYRQALSAPALSPIDPNILNDLESEARRIATSVDTLTESLAGILRSISALTVDCVEIYRDAVCKTCDAVDSNIKAMYQLMAKCEELSKTMKPIYKLAEDIKEVKRLLDTLESAVNS